MGIKETHKNQIVKTRSGLTRVMSFTSGKGGVGKTTSMVNVGVALAHEGRRVLMLDADLGLANVDVLLGIKPRATLYDLLEGRRSIQEIIIPGPDGVSIIPAASGVETMCNLTPLQHRALLEAVEEVAQDYDYLLIDTQAGISSDVMYFNAAASEVVCVINGEPTSLTDAYALIKVLATRYGEKEISILVNNVPDEISAKRAFDRLAKVVERYLALSPEFLGWVPTDADIRESIRQQDAAVRLFPSSKISMAYAKLARSIDEQFFQGRIKGGMQLFFKQLLEVGAYGR